MFCTTARSKKLSLFKAFSNKSSATNRRWHQTHTGVGKQAEQKQTDRMTHSRLCFSPEWDSPSPQAVSQETCWNGREVKRQLNVLASLDKFSRTVVLCGVKYKERLVTSTNTRKQQNFITLSTFCSFFVYLIWTRKVCTDLKWLHQMFNNRTWAIVLNNEVNNLPLDQ